MYPKTRNKVEDKNKAKKILLKSSVEVWRTSPLWILKRYKTKNFTNRNNKSDFDNISHSLRIKEASAFKSNRIKYANIKAASERKRSITTITHLGVLNFNKNMSKYKEILSIFYPLKNLKSFHPRFLAFLPKIEFSSIITSLFLKSKFWKTNRTCSVTPRLKKENYFNWQNEVKLCVK